MNVKWRFQKNNDNGQIISYVEDKEYPIHCYVRAAKRIRRRAIRLQQENDKPIAIFRKQAKNTKFDYIDDTHVNKILQEAASAVHHVTKKDELHRFTTHSIRVGACVLLHSQKVSKEDIQFRLRWRSDSFKMYLGNIIPLAEMHKNAVAKA